MAKKAKTSVEPDMAALNAALGEAERLIRAVRSMIQKTPSRLRASGSGGGRPCGSLIKAQSKVREAELGIVGPRPCGGGKPCLSLIKAESNVREAELGIVGPRPCEFRQTPRAKRR